MANVDIPVLFMVYFAMVLSPFWVMLYVKRNAEISPESKALLNFTSWMAWGIMDGLYASFCYARRQGPFFAISPWSVFIQMIPHGQDYGDLGPACCGLILMPIVGCGLGLWCVYT